MKRSQDMPQESNLSNSSKISAELIGKKLGEFEILKEIGRGGTSTVYEAAQPSLKRLVALKILWRPLVSDDSSVQRFHHEAEAVANLHHPNIVPIYAMGHEDNLVYFAMEKIDGETLDDLLLERKTFDSNKAIQIIKHVARAVSYAHQKQIIHRDIKPSNIMIDSIGRVLVTDFGLAKSKIWSKVTSDNMVVGTPVYMSPEQAQGKETDVRTDIYSMGVVLYEMVTGDVPFYAEEPIAILRKVIEEKPIPPRQINNIIPRNIETIILKCIEKDPKKRYQTVGVFLRDLELSKMNLPLIGQRSEITIFSDKGRKNILKLFFALMISIVLSGGIILLHNTHEGYIKQLKFSTLKNKIYSLFNEKNNSNKNVAYSTNEIPNPILEDIADILYLHNGLKVMGVIEFADKDSVTIKLKIGTVTYPKKEIFDIKYSTLPKREQLLEFWSNE